MAGFSDNLDQSPFIAVGSDRKSIVLMKNNKSGVTTKRTNSTMNLDSKKALADHFRNKAIIGELPDQTSLGSDTTRVGHTLIHTIDSSIQ